MTEADESLRREREITLRLLVESVHDYAIYLLDTEGRIISWNPGAQRLKGYAAEEVVGKHFSIFYPEEHRKAGIPEQELARATRDGRTAWNGPSVRKDGSRFDAHVVITAVRDENGVLKGFGKVTRDVSEFEALKKADRTKDEFVALVSHDLRNPLSVIGMAASSLARNAKDDSVLKNAQRIQRAVDGMTHLVRDFLDVASIADGRLPIEARICESSLLVREAVDAIAPLATEKGLWVQA
ncbi:MAG TPA: PAS domain-containing sensor histidine kinase, partial [Planctomycetota bacterium]|nr:PAS domain-containing sensor histidine kinase [Planctomycetota bacterium]